MAIRIRTMNGKLAVNLFVYGNVSLAISLIGDDRMMPGSRSSELLVWCLGCQLIVAATV